MWRISALNEAGGWKDRTTVEDMDLAVRASLKGWKFVYLGDLMVNIYAPVAYQFVQHQLHHLALLVCYAIAKIQNQCKSQVLNL